ncbi:hypothetical protein [Pseudorhodoplanes sp.]
MTSIAVFLDQLDRACYQEASHAVVGFALGKRIKSVTVTQQNEGIEGRVF